MKRRDFFLVRDVLRGAEYLDPEDRKLLAIDFADAIKVQAGTDPRFDVTKFVYEATVAPVRPAEVYDESKDPEGRFAVQSPDSDKCVCGHQRYQHGAAIGLVDCLVCSECEAFRTE